jgi:hypothetical protein
LGLEIPDPQRFFGKAGFEFEDGEIGVRMAARPKSKR